MGFQVAYVAVVTARIMAKRWLRLGWQAHQRVRFRRVLRVRAPIAIGFGVGRRVGLAVAIGLRF